MKKVLPLWRKIIAAGLGFMMLASLALPLPLRAEDPATVNSGTSEFKRTLVPYSELDFSKREQLFNSEWRFAQGELNNAETTSYDDSSWRQVNLPHDYSLENEYNLSQGEAESGYKLGGAAWYRKSFIVPAEYAEKMLRIEFDGVYNNAQVYINGTLLGNHPYGYSPFAFDLTKYIKFGEENVIAVKVNHRFPSSRWYSGSGIYRDVHLVVSDKVSVARYGTVITTPDLASNTTSPQVHVKSTINNANGEAKNVTLQHKVFLNGAEVAASGEETLAVEANNQAVKEMSFTVNSPTLWSLDNPTLYVLQTTVKVDGNVVDTVENKFGFRFFNFDRDTGFSLNGQAMKLQGVCMHHDQGALGARAYADAIARQIDILKDMGVNTIRVTHNPAAQVLLDLASAKGMMIIEEMFDTWTNQKNYNTHDYSGVFNTQIGGENKILDKLSDSMTWAEFDTKETVARGLNQPAIIMWSIGNEILETTQYNFGTYPQLAGNIANWIKAVDPTRPATLGDNKIKGNNGTAIAMAQAVADAGGIVGLNYADANVLTKYHNSKPNWKIYASESSSAINSRGIYNERWSADSYNQGKTNSHNLTSYDRSRVGWGHTSAQSWNFALKNDFVAGEFVWTGFDYLGEPTPWNGVSAGAQGGKNSPKSSYFGIVDITGFPKDRYYFYRSQWNSKDTTLHVLPVWQRDMVLENNGKVDVVVYTNAHSVKLYFEGNDGRRELVGEKAFTEKTTGAGFKYRVYEGADKSNRDFENLFFTFQVPFREGKLIAEAYDVQGNKIESTVGNAEVSGFGAATKLSAKVNKTNLTANQKDLAYVEIAVKDAQDRFVANSELPITVEVTGGGAKLVAVDNGKQDDLTPYTEKTRKAFSGKLLAILQATDTPGTATVTISSPGLEATTVTVSSSGDSSGSNISSYEMVKNYYFPLNSNPKLEATIKVNMLDGSSNEYPVTFNTANLDNTKEGTQTVKGEVAVAGMAKPLEVYANVTFVDTVAVVLNYSAAVEINTNFNLPKSRPAAMADGTITKVEFPVTWENPDVVKTDTVGVYVVNGQADVFGKLYPVKATIRVAGKDITMHENVAPLYSNLTQSVPQDKQSDNIRALTDGVKQGKAVTGDFNDSVWTNYKYAQEGHQDASIEFTYATNNISDELKLYVYEDSWAATMPENFKLYYAGDGDQWVEITDYRKEVGETSTKKPSTTEVRFTYPQVTFLKFKIELIGRKGQVQGKSHYYCSGLAEVEINAPKTEFTVNSTVLPHRLLVNGQQVMEKSLDYGMDVEEEVVGVKEEDNSNNVAVTVLPLYQGVVRVVLESEDHSKLKVMPIRVEQTTANALPADSPARDIPADELDANVASFQNNQDARKAFDDQSNTLWHTKWNENLANSPEKRFIEIILNEPTGVEAVRYLPRQDGQTNGRVVEYEIYAEINGEYQKVAEGSWPGTGNDWQIANFPAVVTSKLKLVGKRTLSDRGDNIFMSAAEIRVRKSKPNPTELNSGNTTISGVESSYPFKGQAVKPQPQVRYGTDVTLLENVDYVLTYENNQAPGEAKVIVNGIGNYRGKIEKTYQLVISSVNLGDGLRYTVNSVPAIDENDVNDVISHQVVVKGDLSDHTADERISAEVKAKKVITSDAVYNVGTDQLALVYDIVLWSNGKKISPATGNFKVSIDNVKRTPLAVYDVEKKATVDFTYADATVTFAATHFSEYALVFAAETGATTTVEENTSATEPAAPTNVPVTPVAPSLTTPSATTEAHKPTVTAADSDNLVIEKINDNYYVKRDGKISNYRQIVTKTGESDQAFIYVALVVLALVLLLKRNYTKVEK